MSDENKMKAASKNIQGKAQEAVGDLTGDPEQEAKGQGKQTEAKVRNASEDIKDKAKQIME